MTKLFNEITLDKDVPIPLYYQLKQQILSLIETGKLTEGDMIPPENELCTLFSISRPTVRQSLNELVSEGYLTRSKGRGTFVAKPKIEARFLSSLETFNQEMHAKNMTPRTEVMALKKITEPHEADEKLQIPHSAPIIHLSRLRLANDNPIVFVDTYLPYDDFSKLLTIDFTVSSLYDTIEEVYNIRVNRVQREVEAVNSHRNEAQLLKIPTNSAISLVRTIGYSTGYNGPVEYSVARYRGDMNKFSVEIFR